MATSNFARLTNASKYFVVLTSYENEEGETVYPDDWEYKDLLMNIRESITEMGGYVSDKYTGSDSYPARTLGSLSSSRMYGDIEVYIELEMFITSGYYDGATLDYTIKMYDGVDTEDIAQYDNDTGTLLDRTFYLDGYLTPVTDMNLGLRKIQMRNAQKYADKQIQEMRTKIENLFDKVAEHKLGCSGIFSNGEAVYHKVD